MENSKTKFKKRYINFLKCSNEDKLDEKALESEAEMAAELVDCESYIEATDSEWCQLCADDSDVMHATGYALTDLGHETESERTNKLAGLKSGIILPVVVPVCDRCKVRHRMVQYVPTLLCTAIAIVALVITTTPAVKQKLYEGNLFVPATMRPFFLFVLIVAVAVVLCAGLRRFMMDSFSEKTVFSPLKIKRLHSLEENGWKKLYKNRQFKFMFERARPPYTYDDECCCDECNDMVQDDTREFTERETQPDDQETDDTLWDE